MIAQPLQVVDNFLMEVTVGDALLVLFVLSLLAAIPLRSRKVHALQVITFGLLFMLTPQSMLGATHWKFVGLGLVTVGPMVYITARK